jgi:hypothetical protein
MVQIGGQLEPFEAKGAVNHSPAVPHGQGKVLQWRAEKRELRKGAPLNDIAGNVFPG